MVGECFFSCSVRVLFVFARSVCVCFSMGRCAFYPVSVRAFSSEGLCVLFFSMGLCAFFQMSVCVFLIFLSCRCCVFVYGRCVSISVAVC